MMMKLSMTCRESFCRKRFETSSMKAVSGLWTRLSGLERVAHRMGCAQRNPSPPARPSDGFRKGSTHPTRYAIAPYVLVNLDLVHPFCSLRSVLGDLDAFNGWRTSFQRHHIKQE